MPHPLLVIDPGVKSPSTEGAAVCRELFPGETIVRRPGLQAAERITPAFGYDVCAIVVLGSAASVRKPPAWLDDLAAWLRPVIAGEVVRPYFGICFGHQLLASVAGAPVVDVHPDQSFELGFKTSRFSPSRLSPTARDLPVLVSHRETVAAAPPRMRVVASRPAVTIDALEHESLPLFGVQFHPEAGERFLVSHDLGVTPAFEPTRAAGRELIGRFLALAAASSPAT